MAEPRTPVALFISYAHADAALCQEFVTQLGTLRHDLGLKVWRDEQISAGSEWNPEIRKQLDAAQIIVMLVSPAFQNSDFIRNHEVPRALERLTDGIAHVIPVIISACDWEDGPLGHLQALPNGGVPVDTVPAGPARAQVWKSVVQAIRKRVKELATVPTPQRYLILRAMHANDFSHQPRIAPVSDGATEVTVEDLRTELIRSDGEESPLVRLKAPFELTVTGTLFPCALLSSGWWERHKREKKVWGGWQNDVQSWLFNGFDLWAPSWDFTWAAEAGDQAPARFVAQLGSGDEADSIPVYFSPERAKRLIAEFRDGWGGFQAKVTGLLGHRRHFRADFQQVDCFGGTLDYCLWIDDDIRQHGVRRLAKRYDSTLYSGYVWKCVAPAEAWETRRPLDLSDVYFVWDHTNFARRDAVAYSLDALVHKERFIESSLLKKRRGGLVLLQKSSDLVPGDCKFSRAEAYDLIFAQSERSI